MAEKLKVFIAVLADGMTQHATHSLLAYHLPFISMDPNTPYTFAYWVEAARSPQDYKRNKIIEQFLDTECDVLMMIDHDMIIDMSVLDLLATKNYDIAGPLQYSMKGADPEKGHDIPRCMPCAFVRDTENGGAMKPVWPKQGMQAEVDIVGSGVVAIKRRVLEDPKMQHEPDLSPPAIFRNIFEPNGRRSTGLDVGFCLRAKDLGYSVKVNWSVEVGHFHRVNLNEIDLISKHHFALGAGVIGEQAHESKVAQG